jgi:phosphopantothenoylcysteine decarboxylase
MANVLLGVTGSVAAIRTPDLFAALRQAGHEVKAVATQAALYFFDPAALPIHATGSPHLLSRSLFLDNDEWPGREEGGRYRRDDPVLHIELRRWADILVIAPLDANTLAKLAGGLADNCLTCVWRAWDSARPVVLAPAMNTLMWQHPLTARHLRQLLPDDAAAPAGGDPDVIIEWINRTSTKVRIVPTQSKRLACGDVGVGAMAEVADVVQVVESMMESQFPPSLPFRTQP